MPREPILVRVDQALAAVVPEYVEITKRELAAACEALAAGDVRPMRTLGHNLKGSGASFGMEALTRLGATIEACATVLAVDELREHAETLRDYLDRVAVVDG
ncbi:MAG TPA: Hpt domain-containing protein [Vicinamibacterales bacterium]|nr:Hpt domain-containing protein [Vicinamibacterales bacterium]